MRSAARRSAKPKLKPCPFCGGKAVVERVGTARQTTIITCDGCGCRLETGEIWSIGERWNTRYVDPRKTRS
jgi:Lar family restriction alleviation protein